MNTIKDIIKQLDFFEHIKLLRYDREPAYRTLTGGLVSLFLIALFIGLFSSLVIQTFNNSIIKQQATISYDNDPEYFQMKVSPQEKFMMAIGITGLDLTTQRYFDISFQNTTVIKNSSGSFKTNTNIPLQKCQFEGWSGVNDQISTSFNSLNFSQWLCPAVDSSLPLQGKFTSPTFKYARLLVQKCGTISNASTCANSSTISSFITQNQGATLNFYFINSIINAGSETYLDYYLQDSNYFSFDTTTGANANLYFSQYKIETDHSILPWESNSENQGALTVNPANSQVFTVTNNNQYAKVYMRKASQRIAIKRSFAKIDETLAYIGGLLGFLLLLLAFMNLYSKFCYEIEFGDKIFKQNNNGSFGSQHFNFVVFIGYGIYNMLTKVGIYVRWATMKRYHECRVECTKQLDINLLFKKLDFFEEVGNIVLEDHHLKGLFMLPKKKLNEVKRSRRKFLLQQLIYHQLDRKAREVNVEPEEYNQRYEQFFKEKHIDPINKTQNDQQDKGSAIKRLRNECFTSYKRLKDESHVGQKYSQKIINRIGVKDMLDAVFSRDFKNKQSIVLDPACNSIPSMANIKTEEVQNNMYSAENLISPSKNQTGKIPEQQERK